MRMGYRNFPKILFVTAFAMVLFFKTTCVGLASNNSLPISILDGQVSEAQLSEIQTFWELLPEGLREDFCSSGYQILITNQELETMEKFRGTFSGKICAIFDLSENRIILENSKNGRKAILHEIGHYVYNQNFVFGQTQEQFDLFYKWISVYDSEGGVTKYGKVNAIEGFAEAFDQALRYESKTKKKFPDSLLFIQELLKRYEP